MTRACAACSLALTLALVTGCSSAPSTVVTGKGFVLYSALPFQEAEPYRCETEWTIRDLSNLLGTELPSVPIKVFLFESRLGLFRFLNDCCPDQRWASAACFEVGYGCVVALSRHASHEATLRLLRHEVTHAVIASRYAEVPPWIHEGLAQVFELGPPYQRTHPDLFGPLTREVKHEGPVLLPKLVARPWGAPLNPREYAEAWGLTHFLLKETPYGPVCIRSYLKYVRAERDAQEQFTTIFGRSPGDLEPEWRAYVLALKEQP